MVLTGVTTPALVVFGVIGAALVLSVSEVIPNDVTAIGVVVTLASIRPVLGIDIGITAGDAIAGFANPAAVTITAGVVAIAALDVVPIVIAAFAGVFAMVLTGCLIVFTLTCYR